MLCSNKFVWHNSFIDEKKIDHMKQNQSNKRTGSKAGSQQQGRQASQKGKQPRSRSMSNGNNGSSRSNGNK